MSAKIISFATLKGGSGKTTLLMLTAAAIHNRTNKKLLVVDSDQQKSVKMIYNQEQEKPDNVGKAYDVFAFNWRQANPEDYFNKVVEIAQQKYDVIFMDIPGGVRGAEVYYSVRMSDIVIVPLVGSTLDINATTIFLNALPEMIKDREKKLEVFGVVNKQDHSVEYKDMKKLAGTGGMELFFSPISNLVRYRRNISTVHDIADPNDPNDEFNRYFDEFRSKCFI